MSDQQKEEQRRVHDSAFAGGSRSHILSDNKFVNYVVRWRLQESVRVVRSALGDRLATNSPILFVCAGEGGEASWLCDLGFTDVTFSDLSPVAVEMGLKRDPRLKGLVLDAENLALPDNSFDLVVAQDGLHHLPSPVRGFTEMMRVGRLAAFFMEPHDSVIGRVLGTKWEKNGDAVNYVFRWTSSLVEDIASSFLGPGAFDNLSFAYWHHNLAFAKIGRRLGSGPVAGRIVGGLKKTFDTVAPTAGNQFSGVIVKKERARAQ